jgi:hypothetical protein
MKRTIKRTWEPADLKALKAHSKNKTPVKKISREMKRTIGALRWKAHQIGIGLGKAQRI